MEFAPNLQVIMADGQGNVYLRARLSELVPHPFAPGGSSEADVPEDHA